MGFSSKKCHNIILEDAFDFNGIFQDCRLYHGNTDFYRDRQPVKDTRAGSVLMGDTCALSCADGINTRLAEPQS